jgi:hypothetical protein
VKHDSSSRPTLQLSEEIKAIDGVLDRISTNLGVRRRWWAP